MIETISGQCLTKEDVADMLKCSMRTVDELRKFHGLPFVKLGRLVRFPKAAFQSWLDERAKASSGVKSLQKGKAG